MAGHPFENENATFTTWHDRDRAVCVFHACAARSDTRSDAQVLFVIVIGLGLALLCGSALALAGFAWVTVGLCIKARPEEQFLSEQLGVAAYSAYKARTLMPRLTPRPGEILRESPVDWNMLRAR